MLEHETLVKFSKSIISGGFSAVVSISILYVLHDLLGAWYLLASGVGFTAGVVTNYSLQKTWVFLRLTSAGLEKELTLFVVLGVTNLFLNILMMYVLVTGLYVPHLVAQVLLLVVFALLNFYLYGRIFKVDQRY